MKLSTITFQRPYSQNRINNSKHSKSSVTLSDVNIDGYQKDATGIKFLRDCETKDMMPYYVLLNSVKLDKVLEELKKLNENKDS